MEAMEPILSTLRILGIWPETSRKKTFSTLSCRIWCITIITCLHIYLVHSFCSFIFYTVHKNNFLDAFESLEVIFRLLLTVYCTDYFLASRKRIVSVIHDVILIGKDKLDNGDEKKLKFKVKTVVGLGWVYLLIGIGSSLTGAYSSNVEGYHQTYFYGAPSLNWAPFLLVALDWCLSSYFIALNLFLSYFYVCVCFVFVDKSRRIAHLFRKHSTDTDSSGSSWELVSNLHLFNELYSLFALSVQSCDVIFGRLVLLWHGGALFNVVVTFPTLFLLAVKRNPLEFLPNGVDFLHAFFSFLIICLCAAELPLMVSRSLVSVQRALSRLPTEEVPAHSQAQLLRSRMIEGLTFTGWKAYELRRDLVMKSMSLVVTFGTVVVQLIRSNHYKMDIYSAKDSIPTNDTGY